MCDIAGACLRAAEGTPGLCEPAEVPQLGRPTLADLTPPGEQPEAEVFKALRAAVNRSRGERGLPPLPQP